MTCVFGLRIEAMTNICDWIKEFSSYIKLRVSGAGNKYSIWLQFEWLQCCIALSSGEQVISAAESCSDRGRPEGRSVTDLLTPGPSSSWDVTPRVTQWPGCDQCCMSPLSGGGRALGQCWAAGPWPDLTSSAPGSERLRLRQAARAAPLPLVGEAAPGSGLTQASGQWWSVSGTCWQLARWEVCQNKKTKEKCI